MPGEKDRSCGEQNDHALCFGRAAGGTATNRDCGEHRGGTVRLNGQHRPTWFHGDSVCLHFLFRQQWPKFCRPECEHSVLQPHDSTCDDGGQVRLGDSCIAVCRSSSSGTLPTHSFVFGVLLTTCLIVMVALSYLPALALGPVLERMLLGR